MLFIVLGKVQLFDIECVQVVSELFDFFYVVCSDFQVELDIIVVMEKLVEKVLLVVIINGNVDIDMIGFVLFFSLMLYVSVICFCKFYLDMFEEVIEYFLLFLQYIMYVGDNLIKDVLGVYKVGMQIVWFVCNWEMDLCVEKLVILLGV